MLTSRSSFAANIVIDASSAEDIKEVDFKLKQIASKSVGHGLLKDIAAMSSQEKFVVITVNRNKPTSVHHTLSGPKYFKLVTGKDPRVKNKLNVGVFSKPSPDGTHGEGSSANISFNPDVSIYVDEHGNPYAAKTGEESFIGLAHELIHTLYMMNGMWLGGQRVDTYLTEDKGVREEEDRAVGLGEYQNEKYTENKIRQEHNLPLRSSYVSIMSSQEAEKLGIVIK
ncbi:MULTISPECIES: M91 family zinc metallopeptidase [Pantoea]|uniref:Effector protein n=1 Tax=Candidatus Pantoea floridensis TaxID=1938870 RepID=A0A286BL85_9GAMM|nr:MULTISPECIES: M91 family zinc metallopeptidase [Pantoea]PIF22273.1 NleD-like pathogen effector protein (putative zinc metallopeptidase) [Enterobacteriaceae bacterium JKS000233]PXW22273.1 NleD-like pathogen effector protein (putative zinc metallopeptidase) [Pantoea sp. JKS000250]SOD34915.1 Effector protein [Pantoea floridensis]